MRLESVFLICGLPLAAAPQFSVKDAIFSEWQRKMPSLSEAEQAGLPKEDRARWDLAILRIGAPGKNGKCPNIIPPEILSPTPDYWEKKAAAAKTPYEKYTALYFLNRLKHPDALSALKGLGQEDAKHWPAQLHLELQIGAARIHGRSNAQTPKLFETLTPFLSELKRLGKVDPAREQAARHRLVDAGLEKGLLPAVKTTPGSLLTILTALEQCSWETRKENYAKAMEALAANDENLFPWDKFGLQKPTPGVFKASRMTIPSRLFGSLPPENKGDGVEKAAKTLFKNLDPAAADFAPEHLQILESLKQFSGPESLELAKKALKSKDPRVKNTLLPVLRALSPMDADKLREEMLTGDDYVARATAITDLAECPKDPESLIHRLWKTSELDGAHELLTSLVKWKHPQEAQIKLLTRFLEHPLWTVRLDAYAILKELDPKVPWPTAPVMTAEEKSLLDRAVSLAEKKAPVRVQFHFDGKRSLVLKLDPVNAPVNVANFVQLIEKGWYAGRRVGRIVPDFVVQLGSPYDTMDGNSPTFVRCEASTMAFTPGSIGMALSTKDSGSCQIFFTLNATPHLTTRFTRLGEVEDLEKALPLLDSLELGAKIEKVEVLK